MTTQDRWSAGIPHHPKSLQLMKFLAEHDFNDYSDYFDWKIGGDNGEILMYKMDAFLNC